MRIGRTDHDGSALWRLRVLSRTFGENDGSGRNPQVSKLISVLKRIAAEIYGEAVFVCFTNELSIDEVRQHIVMRESETTATPIRIDDGAQRGAIDRRSIAANEVTRNIVTPESAGQQGADDIQELRKIIDTNMPILKRFACRCAIEQRPDVTAEGAMLGIATPAVEVSFPLRSGQATGQVDRGLVVVMIGPVMGFSDLRVIRNLSIEVSRSGDSQLIYAVLSVTVHYAAPIV
jgi:hypothetical protein